MQEPFIGSEALAAGQLTPYQLRSRFLALYQDVYVAAGTALTPVLRAKACWLRSRGRGVLAEFSASALHGARWIDPARPAAIIDSNRRRAAGVRVREERIDEDEICVIDEMRVTTPARTAIDLVRRHALDLAVAAIDALGQAVEFKLAVAKLLVDRYRGGRGIGRARAALALVDCGAQSPKETWLRLVLIRAGLPVPQTQIAVRNISGYVDAYLDMGWEDIKVAVEYDGDQHRTDREQYVKDIRRREMLERRGWIVIRVVAEDHPFDIVPRVRAALAQRA